MLLPRVINWLLVTHSENTDTESAACVTELRPIFEVANEERMQSEDADEKRGEEEKREEGEWELCRRRERRYRVLEMMGWHVINWHWKLEKSWIKGVAVSSKSSMLHILLPVSESRRSASSLPHFLPVLLAYVLIWKLQAANQSRPGISFKQRVWETRRVGTANRNEQHRTIQNNIHRKAACWLETKKRCHNATKQSKVYSAFQGQWMHAAAPQWGWSLVVNRQGGLSVGAYCSQNNQQLTPDWCQSQMIHRK